MTAPPAPPNGATHNLQRGEAGTFRRLLRNLASPGMLPGQDRPEVVARLGCGHAATLRPAP